MSIGIDSSYGHGAFIFFLYFFIFYIMFVTFHDLIVLYIVKAH